MVKNVKQTITIPSALTQVTNSNILIINTQSAATDLNGWLIEVAEIRRSLTWLLPQDHHVGVDESECINHNLIDTMISIHS